MLMEADLPDDVAALRALVLEQARELDALKVFQAEVERLTAIIEALQRHRFGRRSEQLDPDQFQLALEEVETALAEAEYARDKASRALTERPRKTNRGSLPAHLERIEQVVDIEEVDGAQQRRSVRDKRSRVIVDDLHQYLEARPFQLRIAPDPLQTQLAGQ